MKIVILDGKGINPGDLSWDCLKTCGDLTVYDKTPTDALTIERLQGADIAITNKTPITAEILDACPTVRLICVLATGYNVIDCDAAAKRSVPVCNVPDYGTSAVAQFTFALLLEVCHQIGHHDRVESSIAYFRHAFGNGDAGQTAATPESSIAYFRHAFGNGDAGQTAAVFESPSAYSRHAFGDHGFLKFLIITA